MDLINMLPGGSLIFTLLAFIVALSVIVAVHEYGHYIVGRWCGIHAEVFSLGFGPEVYSWHDKHGTKWQLAALPFGGYVKFLGDADAASGKDTDLMAKMDPSGIERTMHGAKLWKRSATVAAGPVFNFIMSIFIFAGIFMFQGQVTETPTISELKPMPQTVEGLMPGDKILGVEGVEIADYVDLYEAMDELPVAASLNYRVEREGSQINVDGPFGFPPLVDGLQPQTAAMRAGLAVGDVITSIDGQPISAFRELRETVGASEGRPLDLVVWRDGETFTTVLTPTERALPKADGGFETRWLIGVSGGLFFEPATDSIGPFKAVYGGALQTWAVIKSSLSGLKHIITGAISTCNLQGAIGIAEISGQAASQGARSFIQLIAVLSTAVGLLNLFPIPVLDGGHLVFHAYEAVTRKTPGDAILRFLMTAGLSIILIFMAFALYTDVICP